MDGFHLTLRRRLLPEYHLTRAIIELWLHVQWQPERLFKKRLSGLLAHVDTHAGTVARRQVAALVDVHHRLLGTLGHSAGGRVDRIDLHLFQGRRADEPAKERACERRKKRQGIPRELQKICKQVKPDDA